MFYKVLCVTDPAPHPLADQALQRLRRLADGNGLTPEEIAVTEIEEKIYNLEATLKLTPLFETQNNRYPGPVVGKNKNIMGSSIELKQDLERRKKELMGGSGWVTPVMQELKAAQGSGWGYNDATISIADQSVTLATSAACPQCQGGQAIPCQACQTSGQIICYQCQGRRQEHCYTCGGRGQNPSQPGQPCIGCNGSGFALCRYCQGRGQVACTQCAGQGRIPCAPCRGTGKISEEVAITCGAKTIFKLKSEGLPSGLRRGLDRIDIINLSKGHATIEMLGQQNDEEAPASSGQSGAPQQVAPVIEYRAVLPYADMKIRFGKNRPVAISVFGKRGLMSGVPSFLDESLTPWRDKLLLATRGKEPLETALKARAIADAFNLEVTSKGSAQELHKLYPLGLSAKTAQEILLHLRLSLNLLTQKVRLGIAVTWVLLSAFLFRSWFMTPLHTNITALFPINPKIPVDLALPVMAMTLGWLSLSTAIRFVLQRRFSHVKIPLKQKIGKTGCVMLFAVFIAFVFFLFIAPARPFWLLWMLHFLKL